MIPRRLSRVLAPRHRRPGEIERLVDGLAAQLERTGRYGDTLDLSAAVETYWRVARLLLPERESLRRAVGLPPAPPDAARWRARAASVHRYRHRTAPQQVYTYWDSPVDQAPPLVRACLAQLRRVHPGARVLDGPGVRELVEVPPRIAAVLEGRRPAHFSDWVRTRVLEEHGGIWVDATCWVPRPLGPRIAPLLRGGTVLPRYGGSLVANWFLASFPGTIVLGLQRRALEAWWDTQDDLPDYFLYHRIFDTLATIVPEFRGQWDAAPTLSTVTTRRLQLEMMLPYREDRVRRILAEAPVHKLSYKYDRVPEGSVLEHLLRGDVPA